MSTRKISDLINELEQYKSLVGDIYVIVEVNGGDYENFFEEDFSLGILEKEFEYEEFKSKTLKYKLMPGEALVIKYI